MNLRASPFRWMEFSLFTWAFFALHAFTLGTSNFSNGAGLTIALELNAASADPTLKKKTIGMPATSASTTAKTNQAPQKTQVKQQPKLQQPSNSTKAAKKTTAQDRPPVKIAGERKPKKKTRQRKQTNKKRAKRKAKKGRWYTYRTVRGDTVASVARRLRVKRAKLKRWNRLKRNRLKAGRRLKYFGRRIRSESVGRPNGGKLVGGISLDPDGDFMGLGFALALRRRAVWGTPELIRAIKTCGRVYRSYFPIKMGASMPVGDLSNRDGGPLPPHVSHQSGRDVDIGFIRKQPPKKGIFVNTAPREMHMYKQWVVLKCFLDNPKTKMVIIEHSLVRALKKYIRRIYRKRPHKLKTYLPYFPGGKKSVIVGDTEHRSHMHVRLKCDANDRKCRG